MMRLLFLFYTQSEAGAPGYLSRKGEQGASSLSQSLSSFLQDSLQVDLMEHFEERAKSLNEDLRWKAFRNPESYDNAIATSLKFFPSCLIVCGNSTRSLKTTEALATQMGLPVCVDDALDRSRDDTPRKGSLGDGLLKLLPALTAEPGLRVVLCGTSLKALTEWALPHIAPEKQAPAQDILEKSSADDTFPTVLAAGLEFDNISEPQWIFDI